MNTEEFFVLAADVQFIPLSDVNEQTKKHFEHESTDIILTYDRTRNRSKIINRDMAALLKEFITPTSWAQGIIKYCLSNSKEPLQVAEETYLLLKEMKRDGYLIPSGESEQTKITQTLKTNDHFKNYTVRGIVQLLNDTEVYRIENATGNSYALKLFSQKNIMRTSFQNEILILQLLDGKINAAFAEAGEHDQFKYIITEWCEAKTCKEAAQQYRNYNVKDNAVKIINLCIAIVNAYEHLHAQNVFHGDVHPRISW
jgi:hypothetical protein